MKIGVISDTHIPERSLKLPEIIVREFKNVDMIIHAGDLVEPEVLDELKKICINIKAVRGNMDYPPLKNQLPDKEIISIGKFKIGIMHGYGHPDKLLDVLKEVFKKDDVDLIIFGHSHQPFNEMIDGVLFFNPGSSTDKLFAPYNSYGIIEINDKIEAKIIKI